MDRPYLRAVNAAVFSLCYLFVLPCRWTFRAKFEREAYRETIAAMHECYGTLYFSSRREEMADWIAGIFGSSRYFWMWNRHDAKKWALEVADEILKIERKA
jgi:hypothetical protein